MPPFDDENRDPHPHNWPNRSQLVVMALDESGTLTPALVIDLTQPIALEGFDPRQEMGD